MGKKQKAILSIILSIILVIGSVFAYKGVKILEDQRTKNLVVQEDSSDNSLEDLKDNTSNKKDNGLSNKKDESVNDQNNTNLSNKTDNTKNEKNTDKKEATNKKKDKENKKPSKDESKDDKVQDETTKPSEEKKNYVYLSISCKVLINNLDKVDENKRDIVPQNGIIYPRKKVEFTEGESVFDILLRETRNNRIHLDFVDTPMYKSAYIKGIANLYEFDAGNGSGWMYSVNGVFPNFGASKYELKNGDNVEWKYTKDLGKDLGHEYNE